MDEDDEDEDDDVLELTQIAPEEDHHAPDPDEDDEPWLPADTGFPEPMATIERPPPPPRRPLPDFDAFDEPPRPRSRPTPGYGDDEGLISRRTAETASHHLAHLARKLGDDLSIGPMPIGIRTVEDVVRELLQPLLKEWLDENLPTVVERLVAQEIDRMIRRTQKF
jgi:cell pole-organizing protein PopZ